MPYAWFIALVRHVAIVRRSPIRLSLSQLACLKTSIGDTKGILVLLAHVTRLELFLISSCSIIEI